MIPRRLIQTARSRELSLKQRACVANLTLLNPEYEWLFFDDSDVEQFVDREFPELRLVFDTYRHPIQRYDLFRYLAVYRLGGYYFDLDVLLARDLSSLSERSCVFPFEGLTFSRHLRALGMDWEIGNYAFGAVAGHPFLQAVIDNCVLAQRDPAWAQMMMAGVPRLSKADYEVLYSTGPGLLSRTLAEQPVLAATVHVLFPGNVCDERSWNQFGEFGVHLMDGSWRARNSWWRRRITQRLEHWALNRRLRDARERRKTTLATDC